MRPRLAIISICLNDEKTLPLFLDNMRTWSFRDFCYVIVDNGSRDHSLDLVSNAQGTTTIIRLGKNLSTTGGYNRGLGLAQEIGAEYVMLLALDVLLAPDTVQVLVNEMDAQSDIGAIGPILFKSHDRTLVECMGFRINNDFSFAPYFGGCREPLLFPSSIDADYIDGGTSLFRLSALREIGFLDESLFMYGEDVDLCMRLRRRGHRVVATSKTRAWHRHTEIRMADPRPRPYQVFYQQRNIMYLAKRYGGEAERRAYYLGVMRRMPRQLAYFAIRERSLYLAAVYLEALWHGFTAKMGKTKYVQ